MVKVSSLSETTLPRHSLQNGHKLSSRPRPTGAFFALPAQYVRSEPQGSATFLQGCTHASIFE